MLLSELFIFCYIKGVLEPGEILLCRNAIVDMWLQSRMDEGQPLPRAYAHFVICAENTMRAFDSFRDDLQGVMKPNNALLLQNRVLRVWMNQRNVEEKIITFRGRQYVSVPHSRIDDLCIWIKEARGIFQI